jgi:hypothetical protein
MPISNTGSGNCRVFPLALNKPRRYIFYQGKSVFMPAGILRVFFMPGGVHVSFTTGTNTEAIGSASANSSAFTGTSAAAVILPTGAGFLPANFWLPSYGIGKSLLVKAYGVLSTTTGTNALTLGLSANTNQGTYNSGGIFATTGAVNQTASLSNVPWDLEVIITCSGAGSSGTFLADGVMHVYPTTSTLLASRCSSSAANPNTALTLTTETAYYIELFALWGASSNSLTVYSMITLGLN